MLKHTKSLFFAILASAALALSTPAALAQDNKADDSKTEKKQRTDYKSPPSPELLALQAQQARGGASASGSANSRSTRSTSRTGSPPGSSTLPSEKRPPREKPF